MLLFAYWFRYTCLLILNTKTARDYAGDVAAANQLGFLQVQAQLREAGADLDGLRSSLDRDYAVLTYLLVHSADSARQDSSVEDRMLKVNYKMISAWYRMSSPFSNSIARSALEEMSMVVAHFANSMGERAAVGAAA